MKKNDKYCHEESKNFTLIQHPDLVSLPFLISTYFYFSLKKLFNTIKQIIFLVPAHKLLLLHLVIAKYTTIECYDPIQSIWLCHFTLTIQNRFD